MEVKILDGTFIFMLINFSVLMAVLWWLLYRPIQNLLVQRQEKIRTDLDAATQARQNYEQLELQTKQALNEAQREAARLLETARSEAEQLRNEQLSKARHEVEQLWHRHHLELEQAKQSAQDELREGAVSLALLAAQKVIGSKMSPEINESLIRRTLETVVKE